MTVSVSKISQLESNFTEFLPHQATNLNPLSWDSDHCHLDVQTSCPFY